MIRHRLGIPDLVGALGIGFLAGLWRPLEVTPSTQPLRPLPNGAGPSRPLVSVTSRGQEG